MEQALYILAAIFFAIDALKGALNFGSPTDWTAAGFCALTVALFLV